MPDESIEAFDQGGDPFGGQAQGTISRDWEQTKAAPGLSRNSTTREEGPIGLQGLGQTGVVVSSADGSRRSTPTIPPGFQALPPRVEEVAQTVSRPSSRASLKRAPSAITPAIPHVPAAPVRAHTPVTQAIRPRAAAAETQSTPTKVSAKSGQLQTIHSPAEGQVATPSSQETPSKTPIAAATTPRDTPSKEAVKLAPKSLPEAPAVAAKTLTDATIKDKISHSQKVNDVVPDASAVEPVKPMAEKTASEPRPSVPAQATKEQKGNDKIAKPTSAITTPIKQVRASEPTSNERNHPGKLDISAALQQPFEKSVAKAETPTQLQRSATPAASSRPESPAASDIAKRPTPKTLRVLPTPKAESPSPLHSALQQASTSTVRSRNPSIASFQPPGTPSSEHISDTASSLTAASQANSPPPPGGRVGTAPVRTKTKNQLKKERVERAKAMEEEKRQVDEPAEAGADEPIQEAILSRKKKAKKPSAAPKPKPTKSAATTRPSSPVEDEDVESEIPSLPTAPAETPTKVEAKAESASPSPARAAEMTPSSLLADLRSTSSLLSSCIDSFFRPLAQSKDNYTPAQKLANIDLAVGRSLKRNPDVNILPDQVRSMLANRHPLRYGGEDGRNWSRGCVTPYGAHLRHLEPELEDKYLELEKAVQALPEAWRFQPHVKTRGRNADISAEFPRFNLEAIKYGYENGASRGRDANAMEKAVEEGSKKGSFLVGDAETYINEFIMPVGNTASPSGHATTSHPAAAGGNVGDAKASAGASTRDIGISPQEAVAGAGAENRRSLEELQRMLDEAKRMMEDKEGQLRKMIKKNRKVMGFTH